MGAGQQLPPYVEYGSRVSAPPPVVCKEGRFLALVLKGDREKIDALVQRVLTVPAQGAVEYRTLVDGLLLLVGSFGELRSGAVGFGEWGSVRETHLSLWLPVIAGKSEGGDFVRDHLAIACPYIFVDNPLSYAGGREDYGYPKAMARFTPVDGSGDRIELEAFGGDFGPGKQADWVHLLTVLDEASSPQPAAAAAWRPPEELVPYLRGLGGDSDKPAGGFSVLDVVKAIVAGSIPQVSLKQVRDAGSADLACYQGLVEAGCEVGNLQWRPAAGTWGVEIDAIESHPIGEDVGIEKARSTLTLEVEFDLTLQPGQLVAP